MENAGPRRQLYGLLHDASEAYLADIPGPVKSEFERFQEAEDRMMDAVWEWSGLGRPPEIVTGKGGQEKFWKPADRGVLQCEGNQLLGGDQWDDQEIERYGEYVELGGSADFEALKEEFFERAVSLADYCDDGVNLRAE